MRERALINCFRFVSCAITVSLLASCAHTTAEDEEIIAAAWCIEEAAGCTANDVKFDAAS